jgi:hypothetical protein
MIMSKDGERQAWTKFVEEREREAKRPRAKKRAKEEASQAELEAGLDDLVTVPDRKGHADTVARQQRRSTAPVRTRMPPPPPPTHST